MTTWHCILSINKSYCGSATRILL